MSLGCDQLRPVCATCVRTFFGRPVLLPYRRKPESYSVQFLYFSSFLFNLSEALSPLVDVAHGTRHSSIFTTVNHSLTKPTLQYGQGSFIQSSFSQTGWFKMFFSSEVPRNALVNGKWPSGAFFTSYMNSEAPNQRFFLSISPSVVVHPTFLQKASKSPFTCRHFFFCTVYPNFPPENLFHKRSIVAKSVEGMFFTSVK